MLINSYNPYDGPNDNPELELPLTAGEYIYVYGDMDDDGFYEGNFQAFIFHLKLQLVCIKCLTYVSSRRADGWTQRAGAI